MKTPYVAEAHDGFFVIQSKQTLFPGLARSFFRMVFFSAVGTTCLVDSIEIIRTCYEVAHDHRFVILRLQIKVAFRDESSYTASFR